MYYYCYYYYYIVSLYRSQQVVPTVACDCDYDAMTPASCLVCRWSSEPRSIATSIDRKSSDRHSYLIRSFYDQPIKAMKEPLSCAALRLKCCWQKYLSYRCTRSLVLVLLLLRSLLCHYSKYRFSISRQLLKHFGLVGTQFDLHKVRTSDPQWESCRP